MNSLNKSLFPALHTDRLILREPRNSDLPLVTKYANQKEISGNTLNLPFPFTDKDSIFWMNMSYQGFKTGERFVFAIELKEIAEFIGEIGIHMTPKFNRAQIGYWIGKQYWNKGYGTEALSAVLKYSFEELKLNKILATHFPHNPSSGRIMQKCGMIKEGELKQHVKKENIYLDLVQYRMTKDEFHALFR